MTLGDFLEKSTEKEFIREFSSRTYLRYFSFVLSERGSGSVFVLRKTMFTGEVGPMPRKILGFYPEAR
jgi:hypothetical protein